MDFLASLEARARAENPDIAPMEQGSSRSSSPGLAGLVPMPPSRTQEAPSPTPASSSSAAAPDVTNDEQTSTKDFPAESAPLEAPATAASVATQETPAPAVIVKPPVKKRPLPKSPPPKKPPKFQPTIRLQIDLLDGIANLQKGKVLEVDVEEVARERGLRVIQSESEKEDSETDGDDEEEEDGGESRQPTFSAATAAVLGQAVDQKSKRKKRVEDRDEGYDTQDSFVDDSELHFDMPKYYVRPERDGFYVHKGDLNLYMPSASKPKRSRPRKPTTLPGEDEEPPKKRARKAPLTNGASPSRARSKSKADDDDGGKRKLPKNAMSFAAADDTPEKKARPDEPRADIKNFTPELQSMALDLIKLIAKTSFVPKNKFPEDLKPPLQEFALKAVESQQYDNHFFLYLSKIFPYNRFTMEKLTKRQIFPMRIDRIKAQQDKLIDELGSRIPGQQAASEQHYTKEMELYESRKVKWQEEQAIKSSGVDAMQVTGEDKKTPISKSKKDKEPPEPVKKILFTEEMRQILYQINLLDDEVVNITREKAELEKNEEDLPKEKMQRKALYSRLLQLFPDEWMSTTLISRQWSQAKAKYGPGGGDGTMDVDD